MTVYKIFLIMGRKKIKSFVAFEITKALAGKGVDMLCNTHPVTHPVVLLELIIDQRDLSSGVDALF